jgi:serine/threonine protein kinase
VLDFGLAKAFLEEDKGVAVSIDGDLAGTPEYMSPEQAGGRHDQIDARTDVYTLGVILYRLVTGGQSPHDTSGSTYEIVRRIVEDEARRPREVSRNVNQELEAILLKALAHEPEARYATAGEFADDVGNYISGEPLTARAPTLMYRLRKKAKKHRVSIMAGSGMTAILVAVVLVTMTIFAREKETANGDFKGTSSRSHGGLSVEAMDRLLLKVGTGGVELTNITYELSEREVTFSFQYRAWNDKMTPITQLHIMRGERVIETYYNRVPPRSPGHTGNASVAVPVPYGAIYDISLCVTLALNVEQGAAHAERPGGHKAIFARIASN